MSRRGSRSALRLGALVASLAIAPGACRGAGGDSPSDTATTAEAVARRALRDSARADSAAFVALPPRLRDELDVRRVLVPAVLADSARAYCQPLLDDTLRYQRRRLRFRLADTLGILYVRTRAPDWRIDRVELVRRPLSRGLQRGFIWDAEEDRTTAVDWTADLPTATSTGPLPRGGPAPRALRALGRLLATLPCTGERRLREPARQRVGTP